MTRTNYNYDAYGNIIGETGSLTDRLYIGREYDRETGLYYLRARYYDAELGRFLERDPLWAVDSTNLYAYVANNPLKYTDPTGMSLQTRAWGAVKVVAGWIQAGIGNKKDLKDTFVSASECNKDTEHIF